jgi:ATP-binding protein involved in chromosome partitioning
MVKDLEIDGNYVSFTVVLTTPACPMKDHIKNACINAVHLLVNKEATVNVKFVANTSSNRRDVQPQSLLPKVKNVIAVVSGKGGVGKSTVAANFALALARGGATVGLMDADIYGPSVPIMFGVRGERPMMAGGGEGGKPQIVPLEKFGIKLMSIGLLVDEKNAVVWRGPMASSAIRQFITDVAWGELDYLVIDMPPGTGDIHLTLLQTAPVTGVIVVTTPQDVALADAKKGIAMFGQAQLKIPIIGLVENMSYFTPAELPENKYYLFGKEGGKRLAEEYDIPFLGQIPLVQSIREGGDLGVPIMLSDDAISKKAFSDMAGNAARSIAMLNANMRSSRVAEVVA